jgi:hypothetical protein
MNLQDIRPMLATAGTPAMVYADVGIEANLTGSAGDCGR